MSRRSGRIWRTSIWLNCFKITHTQGFDIFLTINIMYSDNREHYGCPTGRSFMFTYQKIVQLVFVPKQLWLYPCLHRLYAVWCWTGSSNNRRAEACRLGEKTVCDIKRGVAESHREAAVLFKCRLVNQNNNLRAVKLWVNSHRAL